mmetsp:Transcript_41908/g.115556  ORF Transcript_41908/g.115556 Transcript_41908/m.115556 type:complete len:280 (-) Transcript_41908:56-895(-)
MPPPPRLDPFHRTASELRLDGLDAQLGEDNMDEEGAFEERWPPRISVLRMLQEATAGDPDLREPPSRSPRKLPACEGPPSPVKEAGEESTPTHFGAAATELQPADDAQPEDHAAPDAVHPACGHWCFVSYFVQEFILPVFMKYESRGHVSGAICLRGSFEEHPMILCDALRVALQNVLPAEAVVSVFCAIKSIGEQGMLRLEGQSQMTFPFEVSLPSAKDVAPALEVLQCEAETGGSKQLLPTLVELLASACRLVVRLEAVATPGGPPARHSLLGTAAF